MKVPRSNLQKKEKTIHKISLKIETERVKGRNKEGDSKKNKHVKCYRKPVWLSAIIVRRTFCFLESFLCKAAFLVGKGQP